eukprot:365204-Chlamydomonas_euryale.AAC.1
MEAQKCSGRKAQASRPAGGNATTTFPTSLRVVHRSSLPTTSHLLRHTHARAASCRAKHYHLRKLQSGEGTAVQQDTGQGTEARAWLSGDRRHAKRDRTCLSGAAHALMGTVVLPPAQARLKAGRGLRQGCLGGVHGGACPPPLPWMSRIGYALWPPTAAGRPGTVKGGPPRSLACCRAFEVRAGMHLAVSLGSMAASCRPAVGWILLSAWGPWLHHVGLQ